MDITLSETSTNLPSGRNKSLMISTELSHCVFLPECPPGPVG